MGLLDKVKCKSKSPSAKSSLLNKVKSKSKAKPSLLSKVSVKSDVKTKKKVTKKRAKKPKAPKAPKVYTCDDCPHHQTCNSHCLEPIGDPSAKVWVVADVPERKDDREGTGFVMNYWHIVKDTLEEYGFPLDDVYFTYVVKCKSPKKTLSKKAITCCQRFLYEEAKGQKPDLVFPCGGPALSTVSIKSGITTWVGQLVEPKKGLFADDDVTVIPLPHPGTLATNEHLIPGFLDIMDMAVNKLDHRDKPSLEVDYKTVTTLEQAQAMVDHLIQFDVAVFDVETNTLFPYSEGAAIGTLAFCAKPGTGYCLPLNGHISKPWSEADEKKLIKIITPLFTKPKYLIGHNVKFDILFVRALLGIQTAEIFADTMLMSYVLDCTRGKHGLSRLAYLLTDMGGYDNELDEIKASDPKKYDPNSGGSYNNIPLEVLGRYNCGDVDCTYRVYLAFKEKLEADGNEDLSWLAYTLLPIASDALTQVEQNGVAVDVDQVKYLDSYYVKKNNDIYQQMIDVPEVQSFIRDKTAEALAKRDGKPYRGKKPLFEFNPNSPKQMADVLFAYIGLQPTKRTDAGDWSTDGSVIEELAGQHEMIDLLSEQRSSSKLHGTYVVPVLNYNHQKHRPPFLGVDGCMRSQYQLAGTETGRLASRSPNLQNIPRKSDVKKMFTSRFGKSGYMVDADYSQIELRVLAAMSGDQEMCRVYNDDEDLHMKTALKLYECDPSEIDQERRTVSKKVNFGIPYGTTASGMVGQLAAEGVNITEEEAAGYINGFYDSYPGVKEWIEDVKDECRRTQMSISPFGRIRRFPEVLSPNKGKRNDAYRGAVNHPIQGGASDCTLMSLCIMNYKLFEHKLDSKICMTVHDSIVMDVHKDEFLIVSQIIDQVMGNIGHYAPLYFSGVDMSWLCVPSKYDIEYGPNYKEKEGYVLEDKDKLPLDESRPSI